MKFLLDFLPAIAFLAALFIFDIYAATAVLIGLLWLSLLVWRLLYGAIRKAHLVLTLAATVLGGLTLYLHNETFIKWKPTVVYVAFTFAMAANLLLGRRPFMQTMLHEAFTMPDAMWRRIEFAWMGFWLLCAGINLLVAYNFSNEVWGVYKVVGGMALPPLFMLAHWPYVGRYLKEDKAPTAAQSDK